MANEREEEQCEVESHNSRDDIRKRKSSSNEDHKPVQGITPAKLIKTEDKEKASRALQCLSWEAMKNSIQDLINKVNVGNIDSIARALFKDNIIRGRGLLTLFIIEAQNASKNLTPAYAALIAVINSKFPIVGELLLTRLILRFRRGFSRMNNKQLCLTSTKFIAHLVNQHVVHEFLALEILTLLLDNPTDNSVEIAVAFLKECGQKLTKAAPVDLNSICERLQRLVNEGELSVQVENMVDDILLARKNGFRNYSAVLKKLDLVKQDDQTTHTISLEDELHPQDMLNAFKYDDNFEEKEKKYEAIREEICGEETEDEDEDGNEAEEEDEDDDDDEAGDEDEDESVVEIEIEDDDEDEDDDTDDGESEGEDEDDI